MYTLTKMFFKYSSCFEVYKKLISQEDILNHEASLDLHESIFIKPEKLHLAFGVMCLAEDDNRLRAKQQLDDCLEKIVK